MGEVLIITVVNGVVKEEISGEKRGNFCLFKFS
jgi:hypothetical protein